MTLQDDCVILLLGGAEYRFRYCQLGRKRAKLAGHNPDLFLDETQDEAERMASFLWVSALPYAPKLDPDIFLWLGPSDLAGAFQAVVLHAGGGAEGKPVPELSTISQP
jgi:hypothetical protein